MEVENEVCDRCDRADQEAYVAYRSREKRHNTECLECYLLWTVGFNALDTEDILEATRSL